MITMRGMKTARTERKDGIFRNIQETGHMTIDCPKAFVKSIHDNHT